MKRVCLLAVPFVVVACGGSAATDGGPGDSGAHVFSGDFGPEPPVGPVADIIAAMPHGSWRRLGDTHLADVCPMTQNHYVCDAVITVWSGGAYDVEHDRLIVFGGGHSDSFVNNLFAFDLLAGTWSRVTELPAPLDHLADGAPIPDAFTDIRIESCGLYPSVASLTVDAAWLSATGYLTHDRCDEPSIVAQLDDQQPRSVHSYGNVAFTAGRFYVLGAAGLYPSGQTGSVRVSGYDFATHGWVRGANNVDATYGASAVDARGHVYYVGNRTVSDYDPVANTWTPVPNADDANGYYAGAAVDTTRGVLVATADGGTTLQTWTLPAGAFASVTTTGLASPLGQAPGFEYAADLDHFYAWSGGLDVAVLDPSTHAWSVTTGTGDDPGPQATNGTFGRFRYSPREHVFVAVSSTTTDVYLYKP